MRAASLHVSSHIRPFDEPAEISMQKMTLNICQCPHRSSTHLQPFLVLLGKLGKKDKKYYILLGTCHVHVAEQHVQACAHTCCWHVLDAEDVGMVARPQRHTQPPSLHIPDPQDHVI